ncbi:MAG: hypothetical protein MRZ62_08340 [Brachyspira sp.]|nr:hypothetical protein [Brachyspira sp.]
MVDFNPNIPEHSGLPQLDKDYWQTQKAKPAEPNLFDNLIQTNFNADELKKISVFNPKLK